MKKEKKVRTYQRRTKSGKTITVRAHTASYEAAEKAKEAAKKKGAGEELSSKVRKGEEWKLPMDEFLKKLKEERAQKRDEETKKVEDEKPKKKSEKKTEKKTPAKKTTKKRTVGTGTNGPEPKKKATTKKTATKADASEPAFTRDEFKEWYRGTGSAADKKVAKALRKQLGRSGYRKFEDEAIDNYTSRGHLSMFKRVSGGSSTSTKTAKSSVKTSPKTIVSTKASKTTKVSSASSFMDGYKDMNALREYAAQVMDSTSPYKAKTRKELKRMFDADQGKAGSHEKKFKKFLKDKWLPNKGNVQGDRNFYLGTKKETSSDLRVRADKMDADAKRSAIVKKLGSNRFRTIKDININVVKPNTRSAQLKGTLYVSSDRTKAYYEGSDGKLKKATKSILDRYVNKESKKRSVGTGTNGPEPKKPKTVSAPSMKKELAHLLTGVNGSSLRTWNKPAKFLSRKDGTLETSADNHKMSLSLSKAGWKSVDKVSVIGGTSNFVSPDGKYHAIVGNRKTKIRPIKKGEKVSGHSWDSIFGGNDHSASRYD